MKKVFTLIMGIACTIGAFSQAPEKMSYQAVVRNASGELVKNSPIGMRISILQGSATGTPIYVETQTQATNLNGLVTLEIGGGTPVTGTFAGVDWSMGMYFIKTETDPMGGTSYSITGISQLLSVPYALFAKSVGTSDALQIQINMLKNSAAAGGVVTDYDNNIYNVVKIGTQIWMAENLKTTKYQNGDLIGTTTPATKDISGESSPKYQWAYNGNESNVATYGRLYTWYAVTDSRNVCPTGWHVPTNTEWGTLINFLGGGSDAGGKLKEVGTSHWSNPNVGATNESSFTALPGGRREISGTSVVIGRAGYWYSSSERTSRGTAYFLAITNDGQSADILDMFKNYGYSIRCIKDN